jgi:hypothetical protein
MDFTESKAGAAREIALAFGVPPLLLGLPGDNTFSDYAEANAPSDARQCCRSSRACRRVFRPGCSRASDLFDSTITPTVSRRWRHSSCSFGFLDRAQSARRE